jgi:hypothetical protein
MAQMVRTPAGAGGERRPLDPRRPPRRRSNVRLDLVIDLTPVRVSPYGTVFRMFATALPCNLRSGGMLRTLARG